jgi:glycosyltransferase involved in cell wall biosynthesis
MYKAQDHIAEVLAGLPAFVQTIVVVDDCSPDASYERARTVADARVHFVRHTQNQGVGGAMLSGYKKAVELGAEVIVKMDADDQMDPAYLLPLITPILAGEADYTKGNRFLHARQLRSMPLTRRIGNIGLSFLTKLASGYWSIFDPTNGYTAIHASLIPMLDETAIDRRYFFESSMFLELGLLRAVAQDVYIPARYHDEKSSLSERRAILEFPPRLFKGFARRLWVQYFLRDFSILSIHLMGGGALTLFGLVFGGYHWVRNTQLKVSTPVGTVMLAAMPVILGVQFLLQAVVLDVQNAPTRPLHRQTGLTLLWKEQQVA